MIDLGKLSAVLDEDNKARLDAGKAQAGGEWTPDQWRPAPSGARHPAGCVRRRDAAAATDWTTNCAGAGLCIAAAVGLFYLLLGGLGL